MDTKPHRPPAVGNTQVSAASSCGVDTRILNGRCKRDATLRSVMFSAVAGNIAVLLANSVVAFKKWPRLQPVVRFG